MEAYYERRAAEYDDWYLGRGRFADRVRPGFRDEVEDVAATLSSLQPARTLDVGCGTGFITRHLPGAVVAADRSLGMLRVARPRIAGPTVCADGLRLPFRARSFDRVFTGHVYGHLTRDRARTFLDEVFRLAPEVVILESAVRSDVRSEEIQERVLNDGSRHRVYKRYFDPADLAEELGSGRLLFRGRWFVVVRSTRGSAQVDPLG
jgi:ubiquinone/menaquinone biosynthesis C-methylase UbiE